MSHFVNMRSTANGADLLSKAHEGVPLKLLGIQIGTGMWTDEERKGTPPEALKNMQRSIAITGYEQHEGAVVLTGLLTNAALETGFMMTELGVTAQHPDLGEVLYMADHVPPEMASFLPPYSTSPVEVPIRIEVATGTGTQVVVTIVDRFVSASKADLQKEINEHTYAEDPHPEMRVSAPFLRLPNGYVDRVNEGEAIGFEVLDVADDSLWPVEVKLQVLNAANEDVTSDFAPLMTKESVTLTAPQVPADSVFTARFQTWQHGGLSSLWSNPIEFTVVDVPVDSPAFVSPVDGAVGIGETPTFTITAGASDDATKVHVHTEFVVSKDLLRTVVVKTSGLLGAVTSWTVPPLLLQTGRHYYLHARTQWGDTWSGWTTIDVFTTDQFQFIEAPTILAPQGGAKVMWSGLKGVIATPVVEEGGVLQQDKIEAEISVNGEVVNTITVEGNQTDVDFPTLEMDTDHELRMRVHDVVRGWADWSTPVTFRTKYLGHGVRVDGGIAVGNKDGSKFTFVDGEIGWFVVAPGIIRAKQIWGLYGKDTTLHNLTGWSGADDQTGLENTESLYAGSNQYFENSDGSMGSPAAKYCKRLTFEGCSDYFLLNQEELNAVIDSAPLIDSLDESSSGKFVHIDASYIWASTEKYGTMAWVQCPSSGTMTSGYKNVENWVVPCRRIITG